MGWSSLLLLVWLLSACTSGTQQGTSGGRYSQAQDSGPDRPVDVSGVRDAVPRDEPRSRYGNPESYVVFGKRYHTLESGKGYRKRGIASWYGSKFHGHRTSSGEPYDMYRMSAAHKTLPLPTYARVTNLKNGKSVVVKINDRGPFHENRLVDLSYAAAARLDILATGTGLVELEVIDPKQAVPPQRPLTTASGKAKITPLAVTPAAAQQHALYLQVGAFRDRGNAERLQKRLRGVAGLDELHITEALSGDRRVYRVRIGPLSDVESADRLTRLLAGQGISSPHVVID